MCRAYLWTGGLGIKKIQEWNIAAIGKYVWAIGVKKDNLWIKWINELYIKNGNWWEYQPPTTSSWYWKKLCEVKDRLKRDITEAQLMQMNSYKIKDVYKLLVGEYTRIH